ncbi:MAG: hypothetical protein FD131_3268 [Rhodocyclaceae bacterium]|nr:MAG: hypothetical protein FD131_3268 [Rhodocyclaceae bacterium]
MPRPTIAGTVIRRIDMRHTSSSSNKDYRITISQEPDGQCRVYTEHGPADRLQNGKELTDSPVGIGKARLMADEARDKKINQRDSYTVLIDQAFAAPAAPSAAAPASAPKAVPVRKPILANSLSPASRATLATMF